MTVQYTWVVLQVMSCFHITRTLHFVKFTRWWHQGQNWCLLLQACFQLCILHAVEETRVEIKTRWYLSYPFPCNIQHLSDDDCMEVRRENKQYCSVLFWPCVSLGQSLPPSLFTSPLSTLYLLVSFTSPFFLLYLLRLFSCFSILSHFTRTVPTPLWGRMS